MKLSSSSLNAADVSPAVSSCLMAPAADMAPSDREADL